MLSSLIEEFKKVKDFRKPQGKRHPLWVVLSVIVLAILLGNTSYKEIAKFSHREKDKLLALFNLPHQRLPSYSTLRRVMMGLDRLEIQGVLEETVHQFYRSNDEPDWIAIDGKNLKNTLTDYETSKQNVLIEVSWFSSEKKLVIKSEILKSKVKSEIAQVQDMVKNCGLTHKVFTLDALHSNQRTTQTIIESQNDYLITVKANQVKLYNRLKNLAESETPLSFYEEKDASHGRTVTRKVSVYEGQSVGHQNYPHLQSFMKVERQGIRGKKAYQETLYYISSKKLDAETFALKIKEHWSIENQLHWVKDVIFKEDKSKFKIESAAANFSLLVTLAMNLYRVLGFLSITQGRDWLENRWDKLLIIDGLKCS